MPELPEVQTVVDGIRPYLEGKVLAAIKLKVKKLRYEIPRSIKKDSLTQQITKVIRKAKYILIYLVNGKIIVIHLGMTGKLLLDPPEITKHDHVIFEFLDGSSMAFNDVRKFGMLDLIDEEHMDDYKYFAKLGLEPLDKEFSNQAFIELVKNRSKSIKSVIMDANLLVGVGNIYANEALFKSGIHPEAIAQDIDKTKIKLLRKNIITTLKEAIKAGGSTLKDFAKQDGSSGYFQHNFQVYGRAGEPCFKCKTKIERIRQNGRSSFLCPSCQAC